MKFTNPYRMILDLTREWSSDIDTSAKADAALKKRARKAIALARTCDNPRDRITLLTYAAHIRRNINS